MPEIMQKTVEIRMYGWALLFVTGLGLHFIDIITNRNENSSKDITNYFAIFVYSVAAIYTHYFAAISAVCLYLILIYYVIFKNRSQIKNLCISIAAAGLPVSSARIFAAATTGRSETEIPAFFISSSIF